MSTSFLLILAGVVVIVLAARFLLAGLPLHGLARSITLPDVALVVVGAAGLTFHCVAMFFRRVVEPLPGVDSAVADIRALGTASIVWYVVPAVLAVLGLRRVHPVAPVAAALAFTAVAVTMYDDGPLDVHLSAIFTAVVVLAVVVAALVIPPSPHLTGPGDARA